MTPAEFGLLEVLANTAGGELPLHWIQQPWRSAANKLKAKKLIKKTRFDVGWATLTAAGKQKATAIRRSKFQAPAPRF